MRQGVFSGLTVVMLGLGAPVLAGDAHVACVQSQLTALGHDPGPVDGQVGPRTRAALDALVQSGSDNTRAVYARLPKLSRRAAVGWCREIGQQDSRLRALMPSHDLPEVFASDEVSAPMKTYLATASRKADAFVRERYGLQLASQFQIAAAVTEEAFRKQVSRTDEGKHLPGATARASSERVCNGDTGLGGSMYRTTMTFCGPALAAVADDTRAARTLLDRVMMHEYIHHLQRELAYDKTERWVKRGQKVRARLGPAWMVEGTADVIEARFSRGDAAGSLGALYRLGMRARLAETTLAAIRDSGEVRDLGAYEVSLFAVELLARRYGEDSLIHYWRRVGETDNWYTAFEEVFGLSVQAYEALVEDLRDDPIAATEFSLDKDIDNDGLVAGRQDLPPVSGPG